MTTQNYVWHVAVYSINVDAKNSLAVSLNYVRYVAVYPINVDAKNILAVSLNSC